MVPLTLYYRVVQQNSFVIEITTMAVGIRQPQYASCTLTIEGPQKGSENSIYRINSFTPNTSILDPGTDMCLNRSILLWGQTTTSVL